jgi:zinc transport system permease protein
MMVVPVAAAQLVTRGFRSTMHLAMGLGVLAAGAGMSVAAQFDTAAVVLVAILAFAPLAWCRWRALERRARAASDDADPEPPDVVLAAANGEQR